MLRKTRFSARVRGTFTLSLIGLSGLASPTFSGDRGSIQIVAIAPAVCRIASSALRSPALVGGRADIGSIRQACNTVGGAEVTAHISNLNGGTLQVGGQNIAIKPNGEVVLPAGGPDAATADWRLVNAKPADPGAPVTVELLIVSN
jgi:hypothetical protein